MDDDGDEDSQSELTGSLSWWMMKSLWKEDSKLRLLVADTILLQDGHLLHWLFTSSKSGRVLKVCKSNNLRLRSTSVRQGHNSLIYLTTV